MIAVSRPKEASAGVTLPISVTTSQPLSDNGFCDSPAVTNQDPVTDAKARKASAANGCDGVTLLRKRQCLFDCLAPSHFFEVNVFIPLRRSASRSASIGADCTRREAERPKQGGQGEIHEATDSPGCLFLVDAP